MLALPNSSSDCSSVPSWSYLWSATSWSHAAVMESSVRLPVSSMKSSWIMCLVVSATAFICAWPCESSLSAQMVLTKSDRRFHLASMVDWGLAAPWQQLVDV